MDRGPGEWSLWWNPVLTFGLRCCSRYLLPEPIKSQHKTKFHMSPLKVTWFPLVIIDVLSVNCALLCNHSTFCSGNRYVKCKSITGVPSASPYESIILTIWPLNQSICKSQPSVSMQVCCSGARKNSILCRCRHALRKHMTRKYILGSRESCTLGCKLRGEHLCPIIWNRPSKVLLTTKRCS